MIKLDDLYSQVDNDSSNKTRRNNKRQNAK